jgi:hypothetical protein
LIITLGFTFDMLFQYDFNQRSKKLPITKSMDFLMRQALLKIN